MTAKLCEHCGNPLANHPMTFKTKRFGVLHCSGNLPEGQCTGVAARWCPIHGDCTNRDTIEDEHAPKCECGKLATCYGAYENQEPEFSCDECCGHGNEDGWCKHFSDMPTLTARLRELRGSDLGQLQQNGVAPSVSSSAPPPTWDEMASMFPDNSKRANRPRGSSAEPAPPTPATP